MLMKKLAAGAATTAIALSIGGLAHAQSTASQAQEVVVTGTRQAQTTGGLASQVKVAKDEAIVTQQFISSQPGTANIAQLINLLPGVSYSSEDYTGVLSGDLRIHGFDGAHIAITIDGTPVNDTGNYAVYPGEYTVPEIIDHITVSPAATDVDAPSASAVGGTVNIVTKIPDKTMGATAEAEGGSYNLQHYYAEIDSGQFGPWGTSAYVAGNYTHADKWRDGSGTLSRYGFDGRIYQPLKGTDFISLAGTWLSERPDFYYDGSRAQLSAYGPDYDYNTTWVAPTAVAGHADTVPGVLYANTTNTGTTTSSDTNYYKLHPNPVDFATIRGTSKFSLGHGLTFTFDPSFFYTLANGGGATPINEKDARLTGSSTTLVGKDLNGDGDNLDVVALYSPSNTNTLRYVLSSSLLWEIDNHNDIQLSYTGDYGRHRQTGEYTYIDPASGKPNDYFGARPGYGTPILTDDGSLFRKRDRFSEAILNQVAANYVGKFLDNRLHINLGVRLPYFERDLHEYCYVYNGGNEYCDSVSAAAVAAAYATDLAANRAAGSTATALTNLLGIRSTSNGTSITNISTGPGGVPNFRTPFNQNFKFHKALPSAGATFNLDAYNQIYVNYAQGFSAPKTDDLYTSSPELVHPETSTEYGAGYRYQTRHVTASVNVFQTDYHNRIVQSYDPIDPTLSVDRNVGNARVRGLDLEAGVTPIEHLNLYASATFLDSELQSNYLVASGGVSYYLPTKGKQLVLTPEREFSARATYDFGPVTVGLTGHYISSRYISDVNDDRIPAYALFDLDARYYVPGFGKNTYVQLNVQNLFNRFYISRSTTVSNAYNSTVTSAAGGTYTYTPGTPFLYVGAPSTFSITVKSKF